MAFRGELVTQPLKLMHRCVRFLKFCCHVGHTGCILILRIRNNAYMKHMSQCSEVILNKVKNFTKSLRNVNAAMTECSRRHVKCATMRECSRQHAKCACYMVCTISQLQTVVCRWFVRNKHNEVLMYVVFETVS